MSGSALSLALAETATLDVVVQISLFTGSVAMSAQMPLWPERLTCFLSLLSAALLPAVEADVETARELGYLTRNFISKPGARSATATTVRGHTTSLTLQSSFSDSPLKALIDKVLALSSFEEDPMPMLRQLLTLRHTGAKLLSSPLGKLL